MARSRYCRVCHEFHDLEQAWPEACVEHYGSSVSAGFHVISDSMDPIRSMADGRMYDSKSRYRRELKARGCVELGNDKITPRRVEVPPVRDTLRQVMQQLRG